MEHPASNQIVAEKVGKLADTCDNLKSALTMPLPFHIHKEALNGSLETMRNELREIYIEMTGANPWKR